MLRNCKKKTLKKTNPLATINPISQVHMYAGGFQDPCVSFLIIINLSSAMRDDTV